jgi:hypothetical protein
LGELNLFVRPKQRKSHVEAGSDEGKFTICRYTVRSIVMAAVRDLQRKQQRSGVLLQ